MVEVVADVTASCLWFPSESVTRDVLKMSCIYFELSGICRPAEGFNTPGYGTGSWWGSLQPDGRKLLPSGWRKERYHFHKEARFRKGINLWLTATNKDVNRRKWRTFLTFNSLKHTTVISVNFGTVFGLRWRFLKTSSSCATLWLVKCNNMISKESQ